MNGARTAPLLLGLLCVLVLACVPAPREQTPQAWSLDGRPLFSPPLPESVREDRMAKLEQARARQAASPHDAEASIWLGRRLAYLGRYHEAIAVYDAALAEHPEEPRLYRHRGHRWISVRRFDRAVEDLERAAALVEGKPDRVEPDGLPNARGVPTSTLQSNIWYHLGLAHYLKGDFEAAIRCYRRGLDVSNNPDMFCATAHWLYMALRRAGRDAEAQRVLEPVRADMEIIENRAYHQLLLLYKGERTVGQLTEAFLAGEALGAASAGYGIANWHLYGGRRGAAVALMQRIVDEGPWAAFGVIAAESDLRRAMVK